MRVKLKILETKNISILPDKKNNTTIEFTMENQWICTSFMSKYMSHRDAQLTSDSLHSTA